MKPFFDLNDIDLNRQFTPEEKRQILERYEAEMYQQNIVNKLTGKTEKELVAIVINGFEAQVTVLQSEMGVLKGLLHKLGELYRQTAEHLEQIDRGVNRGRKDFTKEVECTHIECIENKFGGRCPCCLRVVIVANGKKLSIARNEHFHARNRNDLKETWITCNSCNQKLERPDFRKSKLPLFESYHETLKIFLEEREPQGRLSIQ